MIFPIFAAAHGTLDISDRTEVHARASQQTGALLPGQTAQPLQGGIDLYNAPLARLQISTVRWDYGLSYAPTVAVQDIQMGVHPDQVQWFQYANASVAWHNRFVRVGVTEGASYGQINSTLALQAPVLTATTQTAPLQPKAPGLLTLGSSTTDGVISARVDVYSQVTLGGGYTVSGGLNTESRKTLPLLYGPHARAGYTRALTRRDGLSTSASVESSSSTDLPPTVATTTGVAQTVCEQAGGAASERCAPQAQVGHASEVLTHALAPHATLTLSVGVGAARIRNNPQVPWQPIAPYPVAGAALAERLTRAWSLTASAALAPNVDTRTGLVVELVQGGVTATDRQSRVVTLTGGVSVAQTVGARRELATTAVSGDVEADWLVNRQVDFSVGERVAWQKSELGGFFSMYTFVALTLRAPVARF